MAVSTRTMTRHRDYSRLFIALGALAGVIAIAPIVAAVVGLSGAGVTARTAFAGAPAGEYAVLGRSEDTTDIISVARADTPGALTELARVPHLPGFSSTGAVSPDGKQLALISVDGGTPAHPIAALNILHLETGRLIRATENVLPGQSPVWAPGSDEVVFTRMPSGNEAQGTIHLVRVGSDGRGETLVQAYDAALGVYPVGFGPGRKLVTVVLGAAGSVVERQGDSPLLLSANLTRDWKLSPDGSQIAYIEVDTSNGVRYLARTADLDGAGASAAGLSASLSALGSAWSPNTKQPVFGVEPGFALARASAQALAAGDVSGFDVPLGYSDSGDALVVNHWTGDSFNSPGTPALQVVVANARSTFEHQTRFFGWASR